MTKAERGALAFKIAGIVWIARALPGASNLYWELREVIQGDVPDRLDRMAFLAYQLASIVIPAVLFIGFSGRLSKWLLRPDETDFAPPSAEALHTGTVLIALNFLVLYTSRALMARSQLRALPSLGIAAVAGVCLLLLSRRLAHYLHGLGRSHVEGRGANVPIVRVGLSLLGLYFFLGSLIMTSTYARAAFLWPPVVFIDGPVKAYQAKVLWISTTRLPLAAAALLTAAAVAAWLCRGGKEANKERSPTAALGPRTYVELALLAGLIYVFVNCVNGPTGPPFEAWHARHIIMFVVIASVAMALSMGVFYVGRLALTRVARWLMPVDGEDGEAGRARALLILEVAITIIALNYLARHLLSLPEIVSRKVLPNGAVICLGVIVLRSDIAWLMLGRKRPANAISAQHRAAALRPWLILLGAWLVLAYLPAVPAWLALRSAYGPLAELPHLGFVAGLAFIFGAGWLSRLLSYGRIIPKIWRPIPV